ncbi:hypothetical protein [Viridibacillus arvi]|uniref:hypothetical protein n=1 Tax=Viridibacillus arvi TaxID=263475 RepID=UPI0034CE0BD9
MTIMNTYNDLVSAVADEIKVIVKDFRFKSRSSDEALINVFEGYMPERTSKKDDENKDYPAIIVRFLSASGNIDKSEKLAKVRIIIGTFNENSDEGWKENLGVVTRLEHELLKRAFIGPFSIEGEVDVELPEEQGVPYWTSAIDIKFTLPQTQTEINWEA